MTPRLSTQRHSIDDIVITGTGAVCSFGCSVEEIRENLLSGRTGTGHTVRGAKLRDLKIDISPQLARSMGKHLFLLNHAAREAFNRSQIDKTRTPPEQIGFFAGMGMVDYRIEDLLPAVLKSLDPDRQLDYDRFFSGGYQEIYPLWPLAMLNNVAFCQVAISLGIRGENSTFAPHADGGIMAVAEAVHVLEQGKAEAVLAGGVSEEISPMSLARAHLHGLTHPDALGECGAALVLEKRAAADARGAKPLGCMTGFGFACDRTQGAETAIRTALAHAGLAPGDIDLVFSHPPRDAEAIARVFDNDDASPLLISTNGLLGECFAAGPILNTIIGLGILENQTIPPSLRAGNRCGQAGHGISNVLVNGTSYEGQCASMIIEKA